MHQPNLHEQLAAPYYIFAYDYRETSSGVCVLHYLCHALNLKGHEAYVVGCNVTNPNLRTPKLTKEIMQSHEQTGRTAFVLYPEVVSGNPLGGKVVGRYILNNEGFLNGKAIQPDPDDIFFYYANYFKDKKSESSIPDKNILTLPVINSNLFSPPLENVERVRSYLYQHRYPLSDVDFSLLPPDVEVLSLSNPKTLTQLAEIFRSAYVLYSYEVSATCTEAMLCGCPVIYLDKGSVKTLPFTDEFGEAGAAMISEIDGLKRARESLPEARARWLDIERQFWVQLDQFINLTQESVQRHKSSLPLSASERWLKQRVPTVWQKPFIEAKLNSAANEVSLIFFVHDREGSDDARNLTLENYLKISDELKGLSLVFISNTTPPDSLPSQVGWLPATNDPAKQINSWLQDNCHTWVGMLNAGDTFQKSGMLRLALEISNYDSHQMIFCDEIQRSHNDLNLVFRPDFNFDLLLSCPFIMAGHWLFKRESIIATGGISFNHPHALELDLILRLIEENGLNGIGHIDEPLIISESQPLQPCADEINALQRHLEARNYVNAKIVENPDRHYHINYGHLAKPLVSLIISHQDQQLRLERCIESVLEKTNYSNYEIIIADNASKKRETLHWLDMIERISGGKIKVIRSSAPLVSSALINLASAHAKGMYLVFMDSGTAALREDWLEMLLNHAARPEVGAVGAKLLSKDATVKHAGYILGMNGTVESAFCGLPALEAGYMQRNLLTQNMSAVSASCMMIKTSLFLQAEGLDDELFKENFYDVDLCLKLREMGYLIVWTPSALLLHDPEQKEHNLEKINNSTSDFDQNSLYRKWLHRLARDPAYSRNLSLNGKGYSLQNTLPLTWQPLAWSPLKKILVFSSDQNFQSFNRLNTPLNRLIESGLIEGFTTAVELSLTEIERYAPSTIVWQGSLAMRQIENMRKAYDFSGSLKVLDVDEKLSDELFEAYKAEPETQEDIMQSFKNALNYVDRLTVPDVETANFLKIFHKEIHILAPPPSTNEVGHSNLDCWLKAWAS